MPRMELPEAVKRACKGAKASVAGEELGSGPAASTIVEKLTRERALDSVQGLTGLPRHASEVKAAVDAALGYEEVK